MGHTKRKKREAAARETARRKRIAERMDWGVWYGGPHEFFRKFYLNCPKCGAEDLLDVQQNQKNGRAVGFHCLNCTHRQQKYKCAYCHIDQDPRRLYGLLERGPVCTNCVKTKDVGIRIR